MPGETCPICTSLLKKGRESWHWVCPGCAYEKADLAPAINEHQAHEQIDEQFREVSLRALRIENFNTLLNRMNRSGIQSGNLLDVGCAHGWFLEAAGKGFQAQGIEPDLHVYEATRSRGLAIRQGFFPASLSRDEQFDVIVFNDVFEHIPDANAVLADCRRHLLPHGALVLNLPNSSGIFYRLSCWLSRLGIGGFFDRLWQKGLPSPHLHYFNAKNLSQLLAQNDFEVKSTGRLSALRLKGLYTRISYAGKSSLPIRLLTCGLIAAALPFLRLLPGDIMYVIATRK